MVSIQFISVWPWGLTSVRVFLLGNQLLWKLCGSAITQQWSREKTRCHWEDRRTICKLSHAFPVLKVAQILWCPICNHRNSWGIYLNFLFTGLFYHLPIAASRHSMPMEGQARFPQEKLSSFIQWKLDFSSCLHSTMANTGTLIPKSRFFSLSTTAFYSHLYLCFQFKLASHPEYQRCSGQTTFTPLWWFFWDLLNSTILHIIRIIGKPDLFVAIHMFSWAKW